MSRTSPFLFLMMTLILSAFLSACADAPPSSVEGTDIEAINDPFEPMNRRIFDNNDFFDRLLVRPLAELYRATIPPGIRCRVADILGNMKEPVIFANNILQGEFGRAGTTLERFGINTTIGVGGMWDLAGGWGLQQQTGDFGQTLASWGAGEGPYLMLPVYGPSNVRDAIGRGVDTLLSPWQYIAYLEGDPTTLIRFEAASFVADGFVRREKSIETLDALRAGSLDFYAHTRSAYLQYRRKQLGIQPAGELPKIDENE